MNAKLNKELYNLGFKIGSENVLSRNKILELNDAIYRYQDRNKAFEIILKAFMKLDIPMPAEIIENLDNYEVIVNFVVGVYNGYIEQLNNFSNFISLSDASKKYNKAESTLKQNIKNGKFVEGVDCRLFGKSWVFNIDSLEREYSK
ncbi:TPA: hypothetical protein ACXDUQ_003889 [Clostridioides difficile]|uniref:Uncharacterized protein n=1 Tax=Clostridioides difficile TaxID=1496 RepID=A0AB74QH56_CLODI|nr:hypothetical protein [Clostridioides difficile]EGT4848722.1 hypothetical protein [Clostridioides difficile]MBH7347009.1 hypothetical protein [Clostridioides difficile]MCG3604186.1 hypothetical protein [Clostridioides difficile]MCI9897755.1 hypothetical protein [Clostridioides difficile]MCI9970641.1 hypothetical protein [Clostridioides difficile]